MNKTFSLLTFVKIECIEYAKREFLNSSKTKDVIKLPYLELVHNDSFFHVLKYIYTGKLVLTNQTIDRIIDFMSISKLLELENLSEEISRLLIKELKLENVVLIYEEANRNERIQLKESCERFIDRNAVFLSDQGSLAKLSSECFKKIISRNSFGLNELKIFELVKDWHIYNNKTNDINMDLINEIRLELIPSEELISLKNQSNLINLKKANKIIEERILHKKTNLPTRHIQTTTTASTIATTKTTTSFQKLVTTTRASTILTTTKTTTTASTILTTTKTTTSFQKLVTTTRASTILTTTKTTTSFQKLITTTRFTYSSSNRNQMENDVDNEYYDESDDQVTSLQLLANNQLSSGLNDGSITIWNIHSGEGIRKLKGHHSTVNSFQLLGYNKLASGSDDYTIKIWDIDSGLCIQTLTDYSIGRVTSLILLSNNQLASGSNHGSIKIWNIDSGESIRTLEGHSNRVTSLQLLANNQLASGSLDEYIKIWDVNSWTCLRTITCAYF